ncbi:hypothetical protein ONA22_06515 [Mycoplasmopsis cynos]|nr:hypothetical protein [Mycoplasmopsis cynos]WAM04125.1 hypothetical protein ONA22_06515 [Mycoplasmopsis cynos]
MRAETAAIYMMSKIKN